MPKEEKALTFADIILLDTADIATGLGRAVKLDERADKARKKLKSELQIFGMQYSALEIRYTELLNAKELPKNVSKTDWIEQNAGGKVPNGVLQMANVFTSLVLTNGANGKSLLAEEIYVDAKAEWLRDASAIINHCKEMAVESSKDGKPLDWRGMNDVLDTINALSKAGDAGKKLKAIRKRQKGETDDAEANALNHPELTVEMAVAFLKSTFLGAAKATQERQVLCAHALYALNDAWAEYIPADTAITVDEIVQKELAAKKSASGVQILAAGKPVAETEADEESDEETDDEPETAAVAS